jgi:major capsid protein E
MPPLNWLEEEEELSSAGLTVLAQTVDPTDNGELLWDTFLPREDVESVELKTITPSTFRPTADRREWEQRPRKSVLRLPKTAELEMTPIEASFSVREREMQKLRERVGPNQAALREIIGASIPDRTKAIVQEVYRRIEVDAWTAWALGQVTVKNPQDGSTITVSYGFSGTRYFNAPTAWNNGGVNAWDLLLVFLADARIQVGNIDGVMLRQATFNEIQKDAPNDIGTNTPRLTLRQMEQRIQDEIGSSFRFVINEKTLDLYTDGGATLSSVKLWPTGRVAAIPAGGRIGRTAFAPVGRAYEFANAENAIDVNGVNVFREIEGNGRGFTVEAQANAFPNPNENKLYVVNAGV